MLFKLAFYQIVFGCFCLWANAAPGTISGAGGSTLPGLAWGAAGNWAPAVVPGVGDNVVVAATGLVDVRGSTLGGSREFQDLAFTSAGAVTLQNNSSSQNMLIILNGGRGAGVPLISSSGDYARTIAGPGTNSTPRALSLQLNASGDFSVAANTLTISSVISESGGARSINKTGAGTLVLSGANTFTGGATVSGGVLEISGSTGGNGNLRGTATVNAGAELRFTSGDGTGLGFNATRITTLNIFGGLVASPGVAHVWNAAVNMTGGELRVNGGVSDAGGPYFEWGNSTLTTNTNAGTATISGRIRIRADASPTLSLNVADGTAATDLLVSAAITESGVGGVVKNGAGTASLTGANSYTGSTTVNAGTLEFTTASLADAADVLLAQGATLRLAHGATDTVRRLVIGGVVQTRGTWGAPGSGATFTTPRITGTGLLNVTGGPWPTSGADPAGPVLTTSLAVEWNTAGDFESWTRTGWTTTTATGTTLSGTASGTTPYISRTGIASGPDLDLGFNDYVDVRASVPAAFTGSMVLSFGVANAGVASQTGISTAREAVLPNAALVKDGALHTYRFDMSLVPMWRGTLSDLRVTFRNAVAGQAFAFDFIRVGDVPEDIYLPNTTDQPVTAYELSSKHFRFIWDANRETNSGVTATTARGCLRNAEETWAVYTKKLGYAEPSESMNLPTRTGDKFKVNFLCIYDGYWMGGSPTSFGYLNIDPSGLQVDPPSRVIPHEGMHVFQMHQGGGMPGNFWESHANYGRERWLEHYDVLYPSTSNLEGGALTDAHLVINSGRSYYLTWPLYLYLDKNPDGFPDLGEGMSVALWQRNPTGTFPYTTLDALTPQTSVKDILGGYARRMATLDFTGRQAAMTTAAGSSLAASRTELVRVADDATWWRPPTERAPAMGGYCIHPIVPTGTGAGRVVTVNFRGLSDGVRGADWRASLVVVNDSGVARYSSLWNAGTNSVTLAANENTVYLSVAATPDNFPFTEIDDLAYPYRSHPGKQRLHYEVQITGGTPRETSAATTSGLVQHANGGGWKAATAIVNATAFLGPNARVYGTAQVLGTARVEDYGIVRDAAIVRDSAVVSGHATVRENATVRDSARVRDWADVYGTAVLSGNARALQRAKVYGPATLSEGATARGNAIVWDGVLTGGATADGDLMGGPSFAGGFAFGHAPYVGVPAEWIRPAPDRIAAAFHFAAANDSYAFDSHGSLTAFARGTPAWTAADARREGYVTFNGSNQWLALDRALADTQAFTFSAWVKPLGGAGNQALLWMGASTTRRMVFTPDDGTGHAKFSIRNGGADVPLTAAAALPLHMWTHVAITLDGTTGTLYRNGAAVASGPVSIRADALLAANDNGGMQHNYIARSEGAAQPMFNGAVDGVEFYTKALTAAEVAAMQPITTLNTAGTLHVDLRATDASAGTATWNNAGTLGNFTRVGSPTLVANVGGSGIPGVLFDGTSSAYQGPNAVADIEGGSDRSIEVWAWNPALASEETMVSLGHRGTVRQNLGLNFGNASGWGSVTHFGDDLGWGTLPTTGEWHHIAYTYSGTNARVYVDGVLSTNKTLGGVLDTFAGEPVNIGCQRDTANGTRSLFFSGYINSVRIHGGVLTPEQIAANAAFRPAGAPPNAAPVLSAIADVIVDFGASAVIPFTVTDADTALDALTFSTAAGNSALIASSAITGTGASRTATLTPATTGTTSITLTAYDGLANGTRTFNVTFLTRSETWRRQNFGTIANTGSAADTFDADGDGESNILEFATGQNPRANTLAQSAMVKNGAILEFTYTRSKAAMADGVTFAVEWSQTLATNSWSNASVTEQILTDNSTAQTVKASVPAGSGKRFLHLKVSKL